jgi:hypothetical protein
MITQETLKEVLHYDPKTGLFTRLKGGSGPNNFIGAIAGFLDDKGYVQICIKNKYYRAHRLAFLYMIGKFPLLYVDHIDGIKTNNKWNNLREATNSQNLQNQKKANSTNLSTGLLGAHKRKNGLITASIMLNGKLKHLGYFKTSEEAHERYLEEKRRIHEFNTL